MRLLDGRVALITGAGQGIGRAMCTIFAEHGARVAAVDIDPLTAEDTAAAVIKAGGEAVAVACDVSDRSQVDGAVATVLEAFGALHVLVNAAIAGAPTVPLLETSEALSDSMYRTGPLGTMHVIQACHPHLRGRNGSIINFASGAGIDGDIGFAAYAPAKEAVRSLTKVAARELGPDGIRVNAICPRAKTRLMEAWVEKHPKSAEAQLRTIPLRRFGEPEEIATAALFLASDLASYVTGHTLMVDGGSCTF